MFDLLWPALALVLVLEGLLPLLATARWRQMFSEILKLDDGQIRSLASPVSPSASLCGGGRARHDAR